MRFISLQQYQNGAALPVPRTALAALLGSALSVWAQTPSTDSFNPGTETTVFSAAVQVDGKILVVGTFWNLAGQTRKCIGRLNSDGTLDFGFNPGTGESVYQIAVQTDRKIVVGGNFTTIAGQPRNYIARLNSDGTADMGFNPGADNGVSSLAFQADGKIVVGGYFSTFGGQSRTYIARVNTDGTLDGGFNPGANGFVRSLAMQPDGKILVGGDFTTLGGQTRNYIGRLNTNGTLDTGFNPGAGGTSPSVYSMTVQADGKILVGGLFTTLAGQTRNYIGRLNADGTLDGGFNPGANATVHSMALQADGKIVVGGDFTTLGGQGRSYIGRLQSSGALDSGFDVGSNPRLLSVSLQADGKIIVGGDFTSLGGQTRNHIGRLNVTAPATESLAYSGIVATWLRGGSGPEVWRTTFELSNDGTSWVFMGDGIRTNGGWQLAAQAGRFIRARGFGGGGYHNSSAWFVESTLNLLDISTQPASRTNVAGTVATFSVVASGVEPFSYQWWKDGAPLSGATNAGLTISSVQGSDAGGYSVVVTNVGGSITSGVATLTALVPAGIASDPSSQSVPRGGTATFSVTASGTAPLSYQWRKGTVDIGGATSTNYTITNAQISNAGNYQVVVTNTWGSVTSAVAVLTVNDPPTISVHPTNQSVVAGSNALFSVTASGIAPLWYQWLLEGVPLPGTTNSTLQLTDAQYNGTYRAVVSNGGGATTSQVAILTVTHIPGDQFKPPAGAVVTNLASSGPVVSPTNYAFWDVRQKMLYSANPGTNTQFVLLTWRDAGSNQLVVSALVAPWPTNVAAGFPSNVLAVALSDFLRLQLMTANEFLVRAMNLAYQKNGTNALYTNAATVLDLALADAEQALNLLRLAQRQAPFVPELRTYDQQRGISLTNQQSAVKALVQIYEVFLQGAEFKNQILSLKALGKGEASQEYQQALSFLTAVQHEVNLGYLVIAQSLTDQEQLDVGLAYLLTRTAILQESFKRVQVFLPETSGEVILSENYVPNPSTPAISELSSAQQAANEALNDWQNSQAAQRQFDVDQTALRDQLAQLGVQYLTRLLQLTGENPISPAYTANGRVFGSGQAVQNYLTVVLNPNGTAGELGRQRLSLQNAEANVGLAMETVHNLAARIELEERKSGGVAEVVMANLNRLKAIDMARGIANAYSAQATMWVLCADGREVNITLYPGGAESCPPSEWRVELRNVTTNGSFNPGAEASARLTAEEREIIARQQVQIQGLDSAAAVQNLQLDQAQAVLHVRLSEKEVQAAQLSIQQSQLEIGQLITEYQRANTNLASAYFSNPAYRLLRDQTVTRADRKLRSAQVAAYRFARRLEYEWAERWPTNLNTADPQWQANHEEWDFFLDGLETVFNTVNPFQVQDYLNALREWDRQLRATRPAPDLRTPVYGSRLSFRQDILGLSDYDSFGTRLPLAILQRNRQLFREYVLAHVITNNTDRFILNSPGKSALLLRFPLNLMKRDSTVANYFTASISYNHKVENFDFNLVGSDGFRSQAGGLTARLVLLQRGTAALRTLRATQVAGDYSVILMDADPFIASNTGLVWGNPNFAIYDDATINNGGRVANYQPGSSVAMRNRPVAASEWVIFIDNGLQDANLNLAWDKLMDIEILASYHRNAPPQIW